jgi:hypothetical protein
MADIDAYASQLLEISKRFYEKAKASNEPQGREANLTAALLIGMSALEAHVNSVSEELILRGGLSILDQSLLSEKDFRLEKGEFVLATSLKMYRLEDRIQFLFHKFGKAKQARAESWWSDFQSAADLRNRIVHPKGQPPTVADEQVKRALRAVLDAVHALYTAVFGKGLPGYQRGLDSTFTF